MTSYRSASSAYLEALQRYRPGQVKLKTFAEYRIKGAMLDELRSQDWLPRSVKDKMAQIRRARHELEHELGRTPGDEEVAMRAGQSLDEYYRTLQWANDAVVFSFEDFSRTNASGRRAGCDRMHLRQERPQCASIFWRRPATAMPLPG